MVGARRAVATKVGATVVDGMRAADDDRGQPQAIVQAREDRKRNNPHHVRDTCICSYHKTLHVPYRTGNRTLQNTVLYFASTIFNTSVINTMDLTILNDKD
jgi:hypothetical protein